MNQTDKPTSPTNPKYRASNRRLNLAAGLTIVGVLWHTGLMFWKAAGR